MLSRYIFLLFLFPGPLCEAVIHTLFRDARMLDERSSAEYIAGCFVKSVILSVISLMVQNRITPIEYEGLDEVLDGLFLFWSPFRYFVTTTCVTLVYSVLHYFLFYRIWHRIKMHVEIVVIPNEWERRRRSRR